MYATDRYLLYFTTEINVVMEKEQPIKNLTYLSLAQRNGVEFLRKSHLFSKFVEISSWVSSNGQHKDEGSGGRGVFEHKRQVCRLRKKRKSNVISFTYMTNKQKMFTFNSNT